MAKDWLPDVQTVAGQSRLVVVGHRGLGMNKQSQHAAHSSRIRENTLKSFAKAAEAGADFVEFDVQVTKDGEAVIFHDDYIVAAGTGPVAVTELTCEDFLSYGVQEGGKQGRRLLRSPHGEAPYPWDVEEDAPHCTLKQAFAAVPLTCGFNIEVKFARHNWEQMENVKRAVETISRVVREHRGERRVVFSSFHPDAAAALRVVQDECPVLFLTDGGGEVFPDERMNSIAAAMEHCQKEGLQGIVTEVTPLLRDGSLCQLVKQAGLALFTYGGGNNTPDSLAFQQSHGVDGVIVDAVVAMVEVARSMSTETLEEFRAMGGLNASKG